ncbi:Arylamine N-acetyltransferase [Tenacibaculum sp. MAR_2009_124]|uniref:arylamine N-acetyltransferase n=1 Tax=Tenacibaculum sp. MAR_2009_124 TaxID=1250059 RepID=UPI00089608B6|nr:arylamine N-acetyltransferase [Tenacibaculum sp. MAR_2009_124]SED15546.1 Arylamine N-acetyltransferase [Tenacibaculum sp. MAR_2009_124]
MNEKKVISPEVLHKLLNRFKLSTTECNEEGLKKVYQAWCRNIPFDNFWKRLELEQSPFIEKDQIDATTFFEAWLEHGIGGTCWTTTNALQALLIDMGFQVKFVGGSMGDMGLVNHGSLIVTTNDKREFIVDTSISNEVPIEIIPNTIDNTPHSIQLIDEQEKLSILFEFPSKKDLMKCAIYNNTLSSENVQKHHKESYTNSLFNDCVYIKKNNEFGINTIIGNTLYTKTKNEIKKVTLNKEEIEKVLSNVMGLSDEIITHIEKTTLFNIPSESHLISLTS